MKVSILSPVRDEARHIDEMIRSVVDQTYRDWELILLSDGSVDSTEKRIRAWAGSDSRIRLIGSGERVGKVAGFNACYNASEGEIIVLLAGDDSLPQDSLERRVALLATSNPLTEPVVAFFKIRTMSETKQQDGLILPRGDTATSRSGGSITLTRALSEQVFPIDERLVSEDIWLVRAAEGVAARVLTDQSIVLNYRIHDGNSNPRSRSFRDMDEAMAARHVAWTYLLDSPHLSLSGDSRRELSRLASLEDLRQSRRIIRIMMTRGSPLTDRLAFAAMASPTLFLVRKRFFRVLSGRRSR